MQGFAGFIQNLCGDQPRRVLGAQISWCYVIVNFFTHPSPGWVSQLCVVFQRERIEVFSMAESQAKIAQKTWEFSNNVMEVSAGDEIYKYDRQQQQSL